MLKISIITALLICQMAVSAQQGDDGYNYIYLEQYGNDLVVARKAIEMLPGFDTEGHTNYLAYIDPDLAFNGGNPVTNGEFNHNYIIEYVPIGQNATLTEPEHTTLDYDAWSEKITYYDGLGRMKQVVQVKSSPARADIVQSIIYDEVGRQKFEYLPYAITQDGPNGAGGFRPNAISEVSCFYVTFIGADDGQFPYSEKQFDDSPLNRIMKQALPGAAWTINSDHEVDFQYSTNTDDEVLMLSVTNNGDLEKDGYYPSEILFKNETTDENDNVSVKYTNKQGQTLMVKNAGNITQYVYDVFGLLRYVLPPEASSHLTSGDYEVFPLSTDWIQQYCYYYEYNPRKQQILKKLPGVEAIYITYDKRDRVVLSQDGNQRSLFQWQFTKYDRLNRPVISGIYNHGGPISQSDMQNLVLEDANLYETFSIGNPSFGGYDNVCFPELDDNDIIHNINYYDNYSCLNHPDNAGEYIFIPDELEFIYDASEKTKGLLTASVSMVLEHSGLIVEDNKLLQVIYYDKFQRVIQQIADHHKGGQIVTSSNFNFSGDLIDTREHHYESTTNFSIIHDFTYDHAKRQITNTHLLNGADPVVLSHSHYNESGQLNRKKLHTDTEGSSFLQCIDYRYNIRGWLTSINNIENASNDYFAMELGYTSGEFPQYNGNISSWKWISHTYPGIKQYDFQYDDANRLLSATDKKAKYNVGISYDKNGNIESLNRYGRIGETGVYSDIDEMSYQYDGNSLLSVDDQLGDAFQNNGFSDNGAFQSVEYHYDENGNLVKDLNKQISNIDYTWNNLPQSIEFAQTGLAKIEYIYDALGNKLYKETSMDGAPIESTDYIGSVVFIQDELAYIMHAEGRLLFDDDEPDYQYFLQDHLGNTRVMFDQDGTVLQENSYYPFGMEMGGLSFNMESNQSENKYLYNGKELQDDFGLDWYDYGARFYDPQIGRWHSVDPLAEEYYSQSPFHFSGNNPIYYVDDNGMNYDGYTIDDKGNINRVNDTGGDEYDVLYTENDYNAARQETKENGSLKNEYGNPEPANSVTVSSGTFDASNKVTIESSNGTAKGLKVDNQTDAQAIFKFCADNFSVEFGIVTGDNGNTQSIIHTSGSFEYSLTGDVAKNMMDNGFFILETNHSHPGNTPGGRTPSGFYSNGTPIKPLEGDAKSAAWINQKNGSPAMHLMYHPQSGKTYQYNSKRYVEKK